MDQEDKPGSEVSQLVKRIDGIEVKCQNGEAALRQDTKTLNEQLLKLKNECAILHQRVDSYCMVKVGCMAICVFVIVVVACGIMWHVFRCGLPSCTRLDLAAFAIVLLAGVAVLGLLSQFALKWTELRN